MHRKRNIGRYLAVGLSPGAEARLRRHLAACETCRAYYDQQVLLHRALAGNVTEPTRQENARSVRRALDAMGSAASQASFASQVSDGSETSQPDRASVAPSASPTPTGAPSRVPPVPRWLVPATAVALIAMSIWSLHALMHPVVVAHLGPSHAAQVDGAPAADHAAIRTGATLTVGAHGLAQVELAAGGEVRVFPTTRIRFSRAGNVLDLAHGKVWCVVEGHRGGFAVQTRDAVARVTGTSFVVEAEAHATDVRVVKGAVRVEGTGQTGSITVRAGEQTHVAHGQPPQPVEHYSAHLDQEQWSRFLHRVLDRIEHGVRKGVRRLQQLLK